MIGQNPSKTARVVKMGLSVGQNPTETGIGGEDFVPNVRVAPKRTKRPRFRIQAEMGSFSSRHCCTLPSPAAARAAWVPGQLPSGRGVRQLKASGGTTGPAACVAGSSRPAKMAGNLSTSREAPGGPRRLAAGVTSGSGGPTRPALTSRSAPGEPARPRPSFREAP